MRFMAGPFMKLYDRYDYLPLSTPSSIRRISPRIGEESDPLVSSKRGMFIQIHMRPSTRSKDLLARPNKVLCFDII